MQWGLCLVGDHHARLVACVSLLFARSLFALSNGLGQGTGSLDHTYRAVSCSLRRTRSVVTMRL